MVQQIKSNLELLYEFILSLESSQIDKESFSNSVYADFEILTYFYIPYFVDISEFKYYKC